MRPAERRVDHELLPARLVEEALGDDGGLRRHGAERGPHPRGRTRRAARALGREPAVAHEPLDRRVALRRDLFREPPDGERQLARARRRLAHPERDRRRRGAGVGDAHAAGLDAEDLPRLVAEQEDVAAHALDGEILVHLADERAGRLLDDVVVGDVRDRAAARDGGEPGAAARAQAIVHAVPVEQRRAPPASRRHAVGQHVEDRLERGAVEVAIGMGTASERQELLDAHLAGRDRRDALLREDVARAGRHGERVELARLDRAHGRRALHEVVAREREEDALRDRAARVAGAADALDRRRERARGADVAHEVDRADVDAELERRRRHDDGDLARLELLLGFEADAARHAAVVRGDAALPQPFLERVRDALDEPARVHEHDRRAMRLRERHDAVVDRRPQLVVRDGPSVKSGISIARSSSRRCPVSTIAGAGRVVPPRSRPISSIGRCVADRPMRCRRRPASASRRSSDSARCAPRLSCATAWISSTMTVSAPARNFRLFSAVSRM
jgi:hypothetical protein